MTTSGLLIAGGFGACAAALAVRTRRDPGCPVSWTAFATTLLLAVAHTDLGTARAPASALAATSGVVLLRLLRRQGRAAVILRQEGVVLLLAAATAPLWAPAAVAAVTGGWAAVAWARVAVHAGGLPARTRRLGDRAAVAAGMIGATAQAVHHAATEVVPLGTVGLVGAVIGTLGLGVAVVVPVADRVVAELAVATDRRRVGHALRPLRTLLCDEFPEVALASSRTRQRWHRQAAEIRDGLVLLGPYYDATIARAAAAAAVPGHDATGPGADVHAALIAAAVRAHRSGRPPAEPLPEAATRGGRDWTDELAWLVLVSERLGSDRFLAGQPVSG
ncbi:DUF6545 domain-containing protein [Pseudonocardia benzenivorans]|uniref:DUF6545 domain-containing protein n=1 Tax=Pseudonocardia benzenivorans TaxID=228005 RepID=A0ABW3VTH6_9PSEU